MSDIRNSILATLAYYDIFDYPLTAVEIYGYLINPARIEKRDTGTGEISLGMVFATIEKLDAQKYIQQVNGFYALSGRAPTLCALRSRRQKIAIPKYKKLMRLTWWLQVIPYLRGVFVSGSLAISNSDENGDFDVLVIIRAGRLYITRLFLSVLTSLMGVRRGRYDTEAPDKFCFNHYITDTQLVMEYTSLYTAHTYANLLPILSRRKIDKKFFMSNRWLNRYFYNFEPPIPSRIRQVSPSRLLNFISTISEKMLSGSLGDILEYIAKVYQQGRIRRNPVTRQPGGRTIFTDGQLEFHPRSFEAIVIRRYNEALRRLNISVPSPERDSGLI